MTLVEAVEEVAVVVLLAAILLWVLRPQRPAP